MCRFWDRVRHWLKITNFNLPHLYLAPNWGVISSEFWGDLQHQKTRAPVLLYSVVSVILCLTITINSGFCDGPTNRQSCAGLILSSRRTSTSDRLFHYKCAGMLITQKSSTVYKIVKWQLKVCCENKVPFQHRSRLVFLFSDDPKWERTEEAHLSYYTSSYSRIGTNQLPQHLFISSMCYVL